MKSPILIFSLILAIICGSMLNGCSTWSSVKQARDPEGNSNTDLSTKAVKEVVQNNQDMAERDSAIARENRLQSKLNEARIKKIDNYQKQQEDLSENNKKEQATTITHKIAISNLTIARTKQEENDLMIHVRIVSIETPTGLKKTSWTLKNTKEIMEVYSTDLSPQETKVVDNVDPDKYRVEFFKTTYNKKTGGYDIEYVYVHFLEVFDEYAVDLPSIIKSKVAMLNYNPKNVRYYAYVN